MAATLHIVLIALGALVVVATALSAVRGGDWWARLFDFPRLQTAALGLAVLAALLGLAVGRGEAAAAELAFAAVLAAAIGCQGYHIYPYTPLAGRQVLPSENPDPAVKLRLLVANVLIDNRDARGLLRLVRDTEPDMVLAMETDGFWADQLAVLDNAYPFTLKQPQGNAYGMMLFSRLALEDAEVRFLVEDEIPSFRARVVLRSGDAFTFYGVHPRPPGLLQDADRRDAELLVVGREIRAAGGDGAAVPTVVAGDLNDVAWSRTTKLFQRIGGLLDPRMGRGLYSTFHAKYPLLRWPLDHVFFADEFRLVRLERLGYIGSDHFPILIEVSFEPAREHEQEEPQPEPGDQREADERIEEGREEATEEPPV